jgi:hypothetical protein
MSNRLQPGLSVVTLVIAVLGWTPVGQAAGAAVANVVPFAKVAGFAKNAGALNGHSASRKPRAGQIPVLNASGKLPASIGAVGPAGATGAAGAPGVAGYQLVTKSVNVSEKGADGTISCPGGKSVLAGGYNLGSANDNLIVFDSHASSASDWKVRLRNTTGNPGAVTLFAVCATVSS